MRRAKRRKWRRPRLVFLIHERLQPPPRHVEKMFAKLRRRIRLLCEPHAVSCVFFKFKAIFSVRRHDTKSQTRRRPAERSNHPFTATVCQAHDKLCIKNFPAAQRFGDRPFRRKCLVSVSGSASKFLINAISGAKIVQTMGPIAARINSVARLGGGVLWRIAFRTHLGI